MSVNTTDLARQKHIAGDLNLKTDALYFCLIGTGATINEDTEYLDEVADSYEITGTGYTGGFEGAGRKAVGTRTDSHNGSTHKASLDCDDVTWTALDAGTIALVVIFKKGTADDDSLVVGWDNITDIATNGGDWTYQVSASGLFTE